jgi:nucleotide-binding universal stress UspA family protein
VGREWDDAIDDVDWQEGDIMLLGSSEQNAVAGVFIGTNASRILRKAPVPVVVLPKPARTPRLKPKRS